MLQKIQPVQVDTKEEVTREFNKLIDNSNLMEAKLCQVAAQNESLAAKIKRLMPKKQAPPPKMELPKKEKPPEEKSSKKKSKKKSRKGSITMKTLVSIVIAVVVLFSSVSFGADQWPITEDNVATSNQLVQLLRNRFSNQTGNYFTFDPTDTVPPDEEGRVYYDDSENKLQLYNGTSWLTIDLAGGVSLDSAYDFGTAGAGRTITAHDGSVVIQSTETDTNAIFTLTHSGIMGTDQVMLITKSGAGDMPCIEFENTGGGADLEGTGATWSISKAGATIVSAIDVTGSTGATFSNDETITNAVNNKFEFDGDQEDMTLDLSQGNIVGITSDTSAVTFDFGTFNTLTGMETITGSADGDFTLQTTSDTASEDLIISQLGSGAYSVIIQSAGTGTDSIQLITTTGGIDIDGIDDMAITNTASTSEDDFNIQQVGSFDASLILTSAGTGSDAIKLETTNSAGDIWIDTGDDLVIDVAGIIDIDVVGDWDITGTAGVNITSAEAADGAITITTSNAAGNIIITSADATADALDINASAGGIDIDADDGITIDAAGADTEDIALTNTGGSIILSATEDATDAINIDATAGGIDIDAVGENGDDISLVNTGGSILLTATESAVDSIKLQSTLGGIQIYCDASTNEDIDISNSGGAVHIKSTEASDDAIHLEATSTTGQIHIETADTTDNSIFVETAGGLDIDAAADVTIDVATAGDDIRLDSALGSIYIEGKESADNAIQLLATAGGIDITATSGGTTEDIDITCAGGSIILIAQESTGGVISLLTTGGGGAAETIKLQNDQGSSTDAIDIDADAGGIMLDNAGAGKDITLTSDGGSIYLQADQASVTDAVKITATSAGITMTSTAEASAWTHTATGTSDDLTISVAGAQDASLILQSAGSGVDALTLSTVTNSGEIVISSHGILDIDSVGASQWDVAADPLTIKITSDGTGNDDLTLQVDGDDDAHIILNSDGTTADCILLQQNTSTSGGILLHANDSTALADGASSIQLLSDLGGIGIKTSLANVNAIDIDSVAGGMSIALADDFSLGVTSGVAGEDILITQTGGNDSSITLTAAGTEEDAIGIIASTGGINITCSAGEDGNDIDISNTGGSVNITATEDAASAIYLRENSSGTSGTILIKSDAGTSVSAGAESISLLSDLGGIGLTATGVTSTAAINLNAAAGGITMASVKDFLLTVSSAATDDDLTLQTAGNDDSHIILLADGSSVDALTLTADLGGIEIDAVEVINIDLDGGTAGTSLITITNDDGTDEGSIELTSTVGGIDLNAAADKDITLNAGQILLTSTHNVANSIYLHTTSTASGETINLTNTSGTGTAAIGLTATAGGIDITAAATKIIDIDGGTIQIDSGKEGASAIALTSNQGITDTIVITNTQGTANGAITLTSTAGGIDLNGGSGADVTIDTSKSVTITTTETAADQFKVAATGAVGSATDAINLVTTDGGIILNADGASYGDIEINAASVLDILATDDINITVTSASAGEDVLISQVGNNDSSITLTAAGTEEDAIGIIASTGGINITCSAGEDGNDIDISNTGGSVNITATEDVASAIYIRENSSSTSGTIMIHADAGTSTTTSAASITLLSDLGGIDVQATGITGTDAIRINAPAGGINVDAYDDINIQLTSGTAGEDILLTQVGANDSSITLQTAGTGADSIGIISGAGGIDITCSASDGNDIDITNTGGSINVTTTETAASQIRLDAQGTIAGHAIELETTRGGIKIEADHSDDGDILIDAEDVLSLTAADPIGILVSTGSAKIHNYAYYGVGYVGATSVTMTGGASPLVCAGLAAGVVEAGTTQGYTMLDDAADALLFSIRLPDDCVITDTDTDFVLDAYLHEQDAGTIVNINLYEYGSTGAIFTDTYYVANAGAAGWVNMVTKSTGFGADTDLDADDTLIIKIDIESDPNDVDVYGFRLKYRCGLVATQ